jgi:hypothetical protein
LYVAFQTTRDQQFANVQQVQTYKLSDEVVDNEAITDGPEVPVYLAKESARCVAKQTHLNDTMPWCPCLPPDLSEMNGNEYITFIRHRTECCLKGKKKTK